VLLEPARALSAPTGVTRIRFPVSKVGNMPSVPIEVPIYLIEEHRQEKRN
jgi:hypothetical protein